MAKTSSAAKNRYAAKAYDSLRVIVPKGRKVEVQAYAGARGESVNGLVNDLLRSAMGLSEEEWKTRADDLSE